MLLLRSLQHSQEGTPACENATEGAEGRVSENNIYRVSLICELFRGEGYTEEVLIGTPPLQICRARVDLCVKRERSLDKQRGAATSFAVGSRLRFVHCLQRRGKQCSSSQSFLCLPRPH